MVPKLLTNREMEIFRVAMYYCEAANIEPGRELSIRRVAKEVVSKLSFKIDEDDIEEMCEIISGQGD